MALCLGGIAYAAWLVKGVVNEYPDFAAMSDVIPQAQVLSERMLKGEYPYQPIPFGDYTMPLPTYLPAHWMPYMVSVFFQFDPRWVSFGVLALAWLVLCVATIRKGSRTVEGLLVVLLPLYVVWEIRQHDVFTWAISLEMMIMGYYLLLCAGLASGRGMVQVLALVLCLMSRFSLLFWVPVFFWVVWQTKGRAVAVRYFSWVALGCLLLYGPFLIKEPLLFFKAQEYYNYCSGIEWSLGERPPHLYNKVGFARYFFEAHRNDLPAGVSAIKTTMLLLTSLLTVFLIWFFQKTKHRTDPELFLLCSLKLSLAVFYSFIQIPYHYLYVVPLVVTVGILARLAVWQPKAHTQDAHGTERFPGG